MGEMEIFYISLSNPVVRIGGGGGGGGNSLLLFQQPTVSNNVKSQWRLLSFADLTQFRVILFLLRIDKSL